MVGVMQTHGMGVDSAAWLTAVLRGDMPAGFDLADLTVVTAMTGDESQRTRWAMDIGRSSYQNLRNTDCPRALASPRCGPDLTQDHRFDSA